MCLSPKAMIGKILKKLEINQTEMILITPKGDTKPWYSPLLDLWIPQTIVLHKTKDLLKQSHSEVIFQNIQMINIHAWRLSGKVQRD